MSILVRNLLTHADLLAWSASLYREGVHALTVAHRVGLLEVGDVALVAVVAASHRSQAFTCAADLVDRVKEVLPVWKNQRFTDGTSAWTGLP